jgi:hypothetical protein
MTDRVGRMATQEQVAAVAAAVEDLRKEIKNLTRHDDEIEFRFDIDWIDR